MAEATVNPPGDTSVLFRSAYPVSFRVINEKQEEKIYLEDRPASGFLELRNDSGRDLYFVPADPGGVTGPDYYHFALKFRPGILKSDLKTLIKHKSIKKGWMLSLGLVSLETGQVVNPEEHALEKTTTVLYFLNQDRRAFPRGEKIVLPLKHLRMQANEGTQVTQVELTCKGLAKDPDYARVIVPHIRHFNLTLINHRGKPHMPIHVGFTGLNAILNDGSANLLILRITNLQKETHQEKGTFTFSQHKHSRMYLYFETDSGKSDYTLGTADQVAGIELDIQLPQQQIESNLVHEPLFQGDNPVWEIYPEGGDVVLQSHQTRLKPSSLLELPDESCMDIVLNNVRSESLMGTTHLYLRLENIPGYWDHTYAIPIVKQPMVFSTRYDVTLTDYSDHLNFPRVEEIFANNNIPGVNSGEFDLFFDRAIPKLNIKSNISHSYARQLRMDLRDAGVTARIKSNLEEFVGIGTSTPTNKLSVEGDADFRGKVGIGKAPHQTNRLSVNGNADVSGNMGIGKDPDGNRLSVSGDAAVSAQLSAARLKMSGESPGNGKFLKSDINGLATWKSGVSAGGGTAIGFGNVICRADIASKKGALILFTGRLAVVARDYSMLLHIDPNNEVDVMLAANVKWSQPGGKTSVDLEYRSRSYRVRFSRTNSELILTYEGGSISQWIQGSILVLSNIF